jgi:uncharacterized membrane protein YoaK (UPF0700 family)
MLIRLGDERSVGIDRHLGWTLAAIAGALNASGFYAVGLYSSNMTGNISSLADHVALADLRISATYLALVAIFVLGAGVSALLINAGRRRQIAFTYAFSILAEAVLLIGLGCADLWLNGTGHDPLLAYGLSFLMGLQNAVVTRISNARVRTTHVTGMLTDIGIELGNLADLLVHRDDQQGREEVASFNKEKLWLHSLTVAAFLIGGVIGVLAYKQIGPYLLFATAGVLALLGLSGILTKRTGRATRHVANGSQTVSPEKVAVTR